MSAVPHLHQEIEEIEFQLDACVRRIRDLENHVRVEIEQQKEEMQKLRGQLRRTLAAISEISIPTPGEEPGTTADAEAPSEIEAGDPDAYADSFPEVEPLAGPFAPDYEEDVSFADPFALILPDAPSEIEEEPGEEQEAPFAAAESFVDAEETHEEDDVLIEGSTVGMDVIQPRDEFEEAEPAREEEPADEVAEPMAEVGPVVEQPFAEEPTAEEGIQAERPTWSPPLDVKAMSDFFIPTDAFSSTLEDAYDADPAAEISPSSDEEPKEKPKSLSEFDRLLDWSDFESEGHSEESAQSDVLDTPSGDGMTATRAPSSPTVRKERPVAITRKTPTADPVAAAIRKVGQDLTVITGIDDEMQIALRRLGVTSLDEIASWHPADAERYAKQLGTVSEREIFDVWVLEAQYALFDLFQQRLRTNRFHNLDEI